MKNIKLYESYIYSDSREPGSENPSSKKFDWESYCPKEFVRELTRASKNALDNMPLSGWGEVGPTIERINYLISSNNSGGKTWKDIMKDSSIIGSSNPHLDSSRKGGSTERILEYFRSLLIKVLDGGTSVNPIWYQVARG
jgi:hypothetical protein